MNKKIPNRGHVAFKMKQLDIEEQRLKQGDLGKWFGDRFHAPINVGWTIIAFAFIGLSAIVSVDIYLHPTTTAFERVENYMITIITTTIGYLFGKMKDS
ncbi:MAG: hypothetical protein IPL26_29925 [Leptospiraceae bacterium]|nr:hypothetical protein [Leptospiraceae bacterium]